MPYSNTVLFIGAHNDECEYGTGGTACLLHRKGYRVCFLNVSCKIHSYYGISQLREWEKQENEAARILGAEKIVIGDRNRDIYEYSAKNVLAIKEQIEEIRPEFVFIHWPQDNHTEHSEVSKASFQAINLAATHGTHIREVYAFEAGTYQTMQYFFPDFFIDIISCIKTVRESLYSFNQPYANGKALYGEKEVSARLRGSMAGVEFAEAYKIIKFPSEPEDMEFKLLKLLKENFYWAGYSGCPWGKQYFVK